MKTFLFAKQLTVVAVVLTLLIGLVGFAPTDVRAQTTAELQAQIQTLLNQIATLQAQLSALSNTGGGTSSGFIFTRNLTTGSTGEDVRQLQVRLNADAATRVSITGVGSPGQETIFFGPLTQNAAVRYQEKFATEILFPLGLTNGTGFVGASTRAHLNKTVTPPSNDNGGGNDNGDTGGSAGTEGSITVTQNSSPSNGTDVAKGETQRVSSFKVEADDSDMTVNRIDLNFNVRPWLYLSSIEILDGSSVIAEANALRSADFTEITEGSDYRIRFTGLDVVVPEGEKRNLVVRVTGRSNTDRSGTTITITHKSNSVRATDTAGFVHEEPNSSFTRTFDFEDNTTGNVVLRLSANSPEERNVRVTDTGVTEGVELMRFEVEAEHQSIDINSLRFDINTSGDSVSSIFDEIYLADNNGKKIASASTIAATTIFSTSDLEGLDDLKVSSGSKKTLRLMADIKDADDFTDGASASTTITANTTNVVAEDGEFDTASVESATITGADLHLYKKFVALSSKSASASIVGDDSYLANVTFKFTVTAVGGDVFLSKTPATMTGTTTTAVTAAVSTITASGSTSGDTSSVYKVGSGSSRTFTLSGFMDNQGGSAGTKKFAITSIAWGTSSGSPATNQTTFGLENLEVNQTLTSS